MSRNPLFAVFLLLSLCLNGVLPQFAVATQLARVNATAPADAVLICTGSSYKWVSESLFAETGKLVFLTLDERADVPLQHPVCPMALLDHFQSDHSLLLGCHFPLLPLIQDIATARLSPLYHSAGPCLPLARAPPVFLA